VYRLAPYNINRQAEKELLDSPLGLSFFAACGNPPQVYEPLLSIHEKQFDARYRRPEWAISNVLGKSDVVPAAADYLGDLRQYQIRMYAEIIRGNRPLDDFDTFVREFDRRGGRILVEQANQLYRQREVIYRIVGASTKEGEP
jgi:hypothetical protein